jgi:uncharacterized protein YndB with AHSA1/START domain
MREYEFLTTWCLDAPIERVFDVLRDSRGYPRWWKGVKSVVALADGDPEGVGEASRFTWRSVLPYELSFDSRVTRVERPHLIEGTATGELEGTGVWRLQEDRGVTVVTYDWRVDTIVPWMNFVAPVARPIFRWNHDWVMARGGEGVARRIGARLIAVG